MSDLVLYHGTSSHRAGNIRRVGLTAPGGTNELRYTLTTDRDVARGYAEYAVLTERRRGARPVVVEIRVPDAEVEALLHRPGKHLSAVAGRGYVEHTVYALRRKIPPRYISDVRPRVKGHEQRWFHGTSKAAADVALQQGFLLPGLESRYRHDIPRPEAVYLTKSLEIAEQYAREHRHGVVLEVSPDCSALVPDEDVVFDLLTEPGKENEDLQRRLLRHWWDSTFDEPWEGVASARKAMHAYFDREHGEMVSPAFEMITLTDRIVEQNPELAAEILSRMPNAAHIGKARVVGMAAREVRPRVSRHTRRRVGPGRGWWRERQRHAAAARRGWRRR